jgi:hypothetical protein
LAIVTAARAEETMDRPSPPDINQAEWPAKPPPQWIGGAVDHGALPGAAPALKGIITPEGFRLELVASERQVIDPAGLPFFDAGRPSAIEWK